MAMTDPEFETYLDQALDELEAKQTSLKDQYGLGHHGRFVVDYVAGTLTFFDNEAPRAEASILPVSTHIPAKRNLLWSWANHQLPSHVRELSSQVKALRSVTGFEVFANERVECDESMAWEFTALACKCLSAAGAYRVPHGEMHAHVLITSIRQIG
jgi:hypothetical protein